MDHSGELSDELDEFEASGDGREAKKGQTAYSNKPYDEAFEISHDLSVAESFDGRDAKGQGSGKKIRNDKYDEAVDVSQSFDAGAKGLGNDSPDYKSGGGGGGGSGAKATQKSSAIVNKPFDEALEFSHSGSDDSVDTQGEQGKPKKRVIKSESKSNYDKVGDNKGPSSGASAASKSETSTGRAPPPEKSPKHHQSRPVDDDDDDDEDEEEEEEDEDEDGNDNGEESYENIEGAYNPKDYDSLAVSGEVRDLFQYIDRYKPQEQELETVLKCFIPEYIPAIGEMDAFIKIPRPDSKDDDLGLKFLDEPAANQSDPTVLELQLRAMSKKMQYGDVAVRSIENAHKNPQDVERWIRSIEDLHRSKPPPQVNYRRSMPDMDTLLDMWPPEFEAALENLRLPSPDLDMSLGEYAKVLCAILDIPVYENPIESLHVMFSLYTDFRNNPHFQARLAEGAESKDGIVDKEAGYKLGGADVMEIVQGHK